MTRIISGLAGSLRLEVPKAGTRPTSDRVREAIFSALDSWGMIEECRVLDLYGGSGALGLEAASRGAREVTLVEKHPPAAKVASRNAKTVLGAWGSSQSAPTINVETQSVQAFLDREVERFDCGSATPWDVVLLDPPYDLSEQELAANLASVAHIITSSSVVLVERSTRSPEPALPPELTPLKQRNYGETALWWSELAS
ncbi:RsmD family RNA methyltransferase [Leucobacter denitrificans]|uniref:RsmD family RNA methyltransferase n=1 Tax=Leucobacter denitrificans TaxID=683042 RepID=A0A7G9S5B5_9MICO|nr:RsmD family RNA methyltransferase [Leucobacter denitrificans]QNN63040.1 RsmD family RNA methyltransferase [Leucobacter denitrificans]